MWSSTSKTPRASAVTSGGGGPPLVSRQYAVLLFLTALAVGCLGVYPHLRFSLDSGALEYFFYSFDEGYYSAVGVLALPGRIVSRLALAALAALCGSSLELAMIAADFAFPFLAVLLAGGLAATVTRATAGRLTLVLGLLFGTEFTTNLFQSWVPWWSRLAQGPGRELMVEAQAILFLFRTPEPQISWSLAFLFLAGLVVVVRGHGGGPSRRACLALWVAGLLLGLGYFPVLAACLVYAALVAGGLVWLRQWRRAGALLGGILLACVTSGASTFLLLPPSSAGQIFETSLPAISPLSLVALAVLALWLVRLAVTRRFSREALLGVTASVTPLLLLNQQVLTGRALSLKIWEEYAIHPFVVLGLAWLLALPLPAGGVPRTGRAALGRQLTAAAVAALILIFAIVRQRDSVGWFYARNAVESAAAKLLDEHRELIGPADRVLFDTVTTPQRLHLRSDRLYRPVLSFDRSFDEPPPTLASDPTRTGVGSPHAEAVYELMGRRGVKPEELDGLLRRELETGAMILVLFFNFQDVWGPETNWRAGEGERIAAAIPGIVSAYRDYLPRLCRREPAPVYWVSAAEPAEAAAVTGFDNRLLGRRQAVDGTVLYLYRQRCESTAGGDLAS